MKKFWEPQILVIEFNLTLEKYDLWGGSLKLRETLLKLPAIDDRRFKRKVYIVIKKIIGSNIEFFLIAGLY